MKQRNPHPFFELTNHERRGIYIILLVSVFMCFLPELIQKCKDPQDAEIRFEILTSTFFSDEENPNQREDSSAGFVSMPSKIPLRFFDPNTIGEEEWISMGLRPKTAHTIRRYIEKGGRFRKPEDLQKIWGMDAGLCKSLIPFVRIKEEQNATTASNGYHWRDTTHTRRRINATPIFINSADSVLWESLPGIGPALAHRIVSYRERLGGFVSVNQLSEVWNLPDSVLQKIKNRLQFDDKIKKMDINQSSVQEFGRHPYFGFRLAKIIVNYREQHGIFQTLEDIQKIALIDKNKYDQIMPYLTIGTSPP